LRFLEKSLPTLAFLKFYWEILSEQIILKNNSFKQTNQLAIYPETVGKRLKLE